MEVVGRRVGRDWGGVGVGGWGGARMRWVWERVYNTVQYITVLNR